MEGHVSASQKEERGRKRERGNDRQSSYFIWRRRDHGMTNILADLTEV